MSDASAVYVVWALTLSAVSAVSLPLGSLVSLNVRFGQRYIAILAAFGAVTGGGLTIIANAPNPAGISLLKKYFDNGVSPARLLAAAIGPTIIMLTLFLAIR